MQDWTLDQTTVPVAARARPWRAARAILALLLLLPQFMGCYSYVPVGGFMPPPGAEVAIRVTDRGRLELSEAIGPGVIRIDGNLVATTDTTVMLGVTSVRYIDLAVPLRWDGERVVISRDLVADLRAKQLSRTRSVLLGVAVAAGAVAASMIAIKGFGPDPGEDRPNGGEEPSQARIPVTIW